MEKHVLSLQEEKKMVLKAQQNLDHFSELYEYYVPKIYRYIACKTNNPTLAEDITAQTFCEALEKLHTFQWRGVSFGSWLYKIAYHLLMDHYKKPSIALLDEAYQIADNQDIEQDANHQWSLEKVFEALKTLPETAQQVVALRVSEGLSHKEIATILGKKEDTVKVIFSRTIQQLKDMIVFLILLCMIWYFYG